MMKQKRFTHFRTIVVIGMVFLTLAAAFLLFRNRLYARLQDSEEQNLADRAQAVSEIFYIKLDRILILISTFCGDGIYRILA